MADTSRYARRAYSYTNRHGKVVHVAARAGMASPKRKSRGGIGTVRPRVLGVSRSHVPAPPTSHLAGHRKGKKGVSISIPFVRNPVSRVKRAATLTGEKQRTTQKHAVRNLAKRQARKQVRKAIPGFRPIRIRK